MMVLDKEMAALEGLEGGFTRGYVAPTMGDVGTMGGVLATAQDQEGDRQAGLRLPAIAAN